MFVASVSLLLPPHVSNLALELRRTTCTIFRYAVSALQLRNYPRRNESLHLKVKFVTTLLEANLRLTSLRDILIGSRKPAAGWHSGFEEPIMYGPRTTPAPEPPQLGG